MGDREVEWSHAQPVPLYLGVGGEGGGVRRDMEAGDWHAGGRLHLG